MTYRAKAREIFRQGKLDQTKAELEDLARNTAELQQRASAYLSKVLEADIPEDGWSVNLPHSRWYDGGEATIVLDELMWTYRAPWPVPPTELFEAVGVYLVCGTCGKRVLERVEYLVDLGRLLEEGVAHRREHDGPAPPIPLKEVPSADELLIESVRAVARDEVRRHEEYDL